MEDQEKSIKMLLNEILKELEEIKKIKDTPYNKDNPDKRIIDVIASQCSIYSCASTINGMLIKEMIRLSQTAENQTKKIINLTKYLLIFTAVLAILTGGLFITSIREKQNIITANNYTTNYIKDKDTTTNKINIKTEKVKDITQNK